MGPLLVLGAGAVVFSLVALFVAPESTSPCGCLVSAADTGAPRDFVETWPPAAGTPAWPPAALSPPEAGDDRRGGEDIAAANPPVGLTFSYM